MKDSGIFSVVLLKDQGNAGQYKQWDVPGGSTAALLPSFPMVCSTHYSVCMKKEIIIITSISQIWSKNLGSDVTYMMWFGLFTGSDTDLYDWLLQKATSLSIIFTWDLSLSPSMNKNWVETITQDIK